MFIKKHAQLLFIISLILLLSLGYLYFYQLSPNSINTGITGQLINGAGLTKSFSLASLTIVSFILKIILEKEE